MKGKATHTEITPDSLWGEDKMKALQELILAESARQSPERKLRNELLAIRYQMEDYISNDNAEGMRIADFVKLYLKALHITQRQLANAFDIKDANLHKYLTGERKLNPDLVLKLSFFSHTRPELWYHIQTKNELLKLKKERDKIDQYHKYDYENIVSMVAEPRAPYKKSPKS